MAQENQVYRDDTIEITDEGIRLPNYYFPMGQSKKILWSEIRNVEVKKMTFWTGKYRAWGMGLAPYWFNQGWRADKEVLILLDIGNFIKPALTPDDPRRVLDLLKAKGLKIFDTSRE